MQTTKFIFVVGLMAVLIVPALTGIARDTEAQIKAREALRQKMSDLEGSKATRPAPIAPQPPPAPAKPLTPAPVAPPAPPAAPPQAVVPMAAPAARRPSDSRFAPVPNAVEDANTSRLREALRQQMAGLEWGPDGTIFTPVPNAVQDANDSQEREALRRQIAALQRTSAPATKPTRYDRNAGYAAPAISTPLVMEAPLPPLSGSKTARLAELLQRYNADRITPKEYHTQRAAILAEP